MIHRVLDMLAFTSHSIFGTLPFHGEQHVHSFEVTAGRLLSAGRLQCLQSKQAPQGVR